MTFETNADVLNWYEKQPRILTPEFISSIPWHEIKNYPLPKQFVPVLIYMRDVEALTDIYHAHLRKTPTGKDKIISKFMERWGEEELTHGEVLNRFLNEAGIDTAADWHLEARRGMSLNYKINARITTWLTNRVGKSFTAAHMTYGAINEMCTLQGYRRLIELANHPVLTHLLRALMREESVHTQFYWNIAKLELERSEFAQKLSRFVIRNFWVPVGQGIKTAQEANYTVKTLFGDQNGKETIDKLINRRVQQLPGFEALNIISERIGNIVEMKQAETY